MPQYYLKIKADLENVKALTPTQGNLWKFDIQSQGGKVVIISEDRTDDV
jgi:hypothetical protein